MTLDNEVKGIISEQLATPLEDIADSSTLASLGADSLDVVETIMAVEDRYGVKIPDEGIQTVGQLVGYVRDHYQPAAGEAAAKEGVRR